MEGSPVPGQEFADAAGRVVGDTVDDIGEPGFGIETIELGGCDQGVEDRGAPTAASTIASFSSIVQLRRVRLADDPPLTTRWPIRKCPLHKQADTTDQAPSAAGGPKGTLTPSHSDLIAPGVPRRPRPSEGALSAWTPIRAVQMGRLPLSRAAHRRISHFREIFI